MPEVPDLSGLTETAIDCQTGEIEEAKEYI